MPLFDGHRHRFQQDPMLRNLLYFNIGVFVIIQVVMLTLRLFNVDVDFFLRYLELPSNVGILWQEPWTLISYMFLHVDFWHLLFNMLYLYWFGQLFLLYFSQKHLFSLYLIGGWVGALFYIGAYNLFPYFELVKYNSFLLGASASIMAIIVALATHVPNFEVPLWLIGRIKLKYIALFAVTLSVLGVSSNNAGGEFSHLGGALAGFLFALRFHAGKDITKWLNRFIDWLITLFKPKPKKFKVSYGKPKPDAYYNKKSFDQEKEIDRILEKIKRSGYDSLSSDEKKTLFDRSHKST
ncbi:MAG: rhomboid family intramembrane serine protease [Microbacter sp.]